MSKATDFIIGAIVLALFVIGGLLYKHDQDAQRDGRIAVADSLRAVEKARGDSLAKVTDSLAQHTVTAIQTVLRVDTVVKRRLDTVTTTIERIVASTVPDTVKVRELVAQIDTLKQGTIAAMRVGENLARVADSLRNAFTVERKSLQEQIQTAGAEVALLKHQARHWGLCASGGYGVVRAPSGVLQAGPSINVGVCYRY